MTALEGAAALADRKRAGGLARPLRYGKAVGRLANRHPLGAVGAVLIVALLVFGLFPSAVAPHRYDTFNVRVRLEGPSAKHWFGTDQQGRDVLSRVVYGARSTVAAGFGSVAVAMVLALAVGVSTGYFGGKLDFFVQRTVDLWLAFPGLIFLIYVISIVGASTTSLIVVMGILFTPGSSRVIRGTVLAVKAQPYVDASRAVGARPIRIILLHVLPNVLPIAIVSASVLIGAAILTEASLSFLGYGIPPPYPSWGRLLQESRPLMYAHPYLSVFPGLAIAVVVFSFNVLGDAIRDTIDPRLRRAR